MSSYKFLFDKGYRILEGYNITKPSDDYLPTNEERGHINKMVAQGFTFCDSHKVGANMESEMNEKVSSASDERVVNNSDAVRHNYRVLNDEEKACMVQIKNLGQMFLDKCDEIGKATTTGGSSRELALAKTNMEQAVMWAVKHVTRP
jgi:hypothetical protein